MLFNELERETTYKLLHYFDENKNAIVVCTMDDGMLFRAKLDTAYETDNTYNDDYDSEKDEYKEYMAVLLEVVEVLEQPTSSAHKWMPGDLFEVWYDRFPAKITDENGTVIYG